MGVSGAGKTTVGRALAESIGAEFYDADDFHPPRNVAKMRAGTALTEADRKPWLDVLRKAIDEWLVGNGHAVLACSALTRRSRSLLGVDREGIELVYLRATPELVESRMRQRSHFMPASLAASQFATLEVPQAARELDAALPLPALVAAIRESLGI